MLLISDTILSPPLAGREGNQRLEAWTGDIASPQFLNNIIGVKKTELQFNGANIWLVFTRWDHRRRTSQPLRSHVILLDWVAISVFRLFFIKIQFNQGTGRGAETILIIPPYMLHNLITATTAVVLSWNSHENVR